MKIYEIQTESEKSNAIQNWKKARQLCYWEKMKWHEN